MALRLALATVLAAAVSGCAGLSGTAWDHGTECREQEDLHPNGYFARGFCRDGQGALLWVVWAH